MNNSTGYSVKSVNPEAISKCSPRHIQSVLEDQHELISIAKELSDLVLTLNPLYLELGAGKMASLLEKARQFNKFVK